MGLADVNADGRLDILAGTPGAISVILNRGAWSFEPPMDFSVPGTVNGLAIFDFDRDGKLDIAAGSDELSIFRGRGDGTFVRATNYSFGFRLNSVAAADFDGDGCEDVFLSQNFFATEPETPRLDAGRGLWLRGDGTGKLTPVPGQESGVAIYGEQRGAALCDYDEDGRVDLVVTQNGAETKLYHNAGARPGLRVRLLGPAANRSGVGALVRLQFADHTGPANPR
jgi:hypothetical protein